MGIVLGILIGLLIGYKIREAISAQKAASLSPQPLNKLPNITLPDKVKIASPASPPASILEDKMWYESEMEFIFSFNETLSLTLERSKVVKCITEAAYNFFSAERSVLLLWDKESQLLKVECAIGMEQGFTGKPLSKDVDSLSMFVLRQREPLVINDLGKESYYKKINIEEYLKGSFISVPLIFQKEVLGVLHACQKKSDGLFTQRDKSFAMNIGRIGAIALQNVQMYEQLQNNYLKTITALALAVDARDSYTRYHSENVTKYSLAIAKEMHCGNYEIELIKRSALLHDIGKIGVKDAVLLKNGKLTPEEFEHIKLHSTKGEEITKAIPFLKDASLLIRQHHERYGGGGYPDGISGEKIEVGARILAVADSFDAMTTDRPYRKALSLEQAIGELERNKGTQFDPRVVECMLAIIKRDISIVKAAA